MNIMGVGDTQDESLHRWSHLRKILERPGPFCHPDFEASSETLTFIRDVCKLLVIGAGGLGCELLKNLALMGFREIHVIDMDTIELSNLNRQFLFRHRDIGKSKAEVAARFVNNRVPGCNVTPHFCKIQDYDQTFYRGFHLVVSGLDSIVARRWINGMLVSLLRHEDDGSVDASSLVPMIDGGTEGFKGNARVVLPGLNACIECTLDLFPPQITYPLCTIANTPRLPEHCIEYVKVLQWPKENPWESPIDGDDPQHINWIHEKSVERAAQFNIPGVTYRLVQGVVKNIIPAVSSTNAVVAAMCATEAFKVATSCYAPLANQAVFNDVDGVYTYAYEAERKLDCLACGQVPVTLAVGPRDTLAHLVALLGSELGMRGPALTTASRTLYMPGVAGLEEATRGNLTRTLTQLGLGEGSEVAVADPTSPAPLVVRLSFLPNKAGV